MRNTSPADKAPNDKKNVTLSFNSALVLTICSVEAKHDGPHVPAFPLMKYVGPMLDNSDTYSATGMT